MVSSPVGENKEKINNLGYTEIALFAAFRCGAGSALAKAMKSARNSCVVLRTDVISPEYVSQCLSAGVRGILSESASAEARVRCLTAVARDELWIDAAFTRSLMAMSEGAANGVIEARSGRPTGSEHLLQTL